MVVVRSPNLEYCLPRIHETLLLENFPHVKILTNSVGSSQFWLPITSVYSVTGESISCPAPETIPTTIQIFDLT